MPERNDFWSRRRRAVAAEEDAARAREAAAAAAEREARVEAAAEAEDDATLLAALGLPDPSSLTSGQDIAAFMAREVPARLRRRAMRALLAANPAISVPDGLQDYDHDYTDAAVAAPGIRSSFDPFRGRLESPFARSGGEGETESGPGDAAADADPDAAMMPDPDGAMVPDADADADGAVVPDADVAGVDTAGAPDAVPDAVPGMGSEPVSAADIGAAGTGEAGRMADRAPTGAQTGAQVGAQAVAQDGGPAAASRASEASGAAGAELDSGADMEAADPAMPRRMAFRFEDAS